MISSDFAYWLSVQGNPTEGSNWVSTSRVLDKASEGDIISVMYHGTDKYALQALKELKKKNEHTKGTSRIWKNTSRRRHSRILQYLSLQNGAI
jgi:hypothetical protein